jgi:hypothetical protein
MRPYLFAATLLAMLGAILVAERRDASILAAGQGDGATARKAYRFEKLADGVFFATGTGAMTTMSNAMVIVNADHTMLVDTSVTPAAARALVTQIKEDITPKPWKSSGTSSFAGCTSPTCSSSAPTARSRRCCRIRSPR